MFSEAKSPMALCWNNLSVLLCKRTNINHYLCCLDINNFIRKLIRSWYQSLPVGKICISIFVWNLMQKTNIIHFIDISSCTLIFETTCDTFYPTIKSNASFVCFLYISICSLRLHLFDQKNSNYLYAVNYFLQFLKKSWIFVFILG